MPPGLLSHVLFSRDEHDTNPDSSNNGGGVPGWAIFLIVILVLAAAGALGLVIYRTFIQRGSSSSSSASNPINSARAWLSRATYKMRNPRARSASAGFEGISAGRARQRGLDTDEAWDARVDQHDHDPIDYVGGDGAHGGYFESTELRDSHRYQGVDPRHDETSYTGARPIPAENPFADENALGAGNLRSVSPRPMVDTDVAGKSGNGHGNAEGEGKMTSASPTRRSLFREDV